MRAFAVALALAVVALAGPASAEPLGPPFLGRSTLGRVDGRPVGDGSGYHPGAAIDFKVPVGRSLIAVDAGTVVVVGEETAETNLWPRNPGRFVLLQFDVPRGPCAFMAYKHLSDWAVVAGQHVASGERIGRSGATQSPSNPHLHLDCHRSLEEWQAGRWSTQVGWRMQWCRPDGKVQARASWNMRRRQPLDFRRC